MKASLKYGTPTTTIPVKYPSFVLSFLYLQEEEEEDPELFIEYIPIDDKKYP